MAIGYSTDAGDVGAGDLEGFFEGWPSPPTTDQHLAILPVCDEELRPFYERFGLQPLRAMSLRRR